MKLETFKLSLLQRVETTQMAKVVVTIDTEARTIEAEVDGKPFEGVISSLNAYQSRYSGNNGEEESYCSVTFNMTPEQKNGLTEQKTVYATKNSPPARQIALAQMFAKGT